MTNLTRMMNLINKLNIKRKLEKYTATILSKLKFLVLSNSKGSDHEITKSVALHQRAFMGTPEP